MSRDEAWFLSDVHLRHGDQDYLDQFLEFLEFAATRTKSLWLVGDIFEFWSGDRQARSAFFAPLFAELRRLKDDGLELRFVRGNRDVLMDTALAEAGAETMPESVVLELGGQRVHLSHGDNFSAEDRRSAVSRLLRSPVTRPLSRLVPSIAGGLAAKLYRGMGHRKTRRQESKTGNRFHTVEKGIEEEVARGDHDVVLCGHIHWMSDRELEMCGRPRRVITTGAWEDAPNYVAFDGEDFVQHRWERSKP